MFTLMKIEHSPLRWIEEYGYKDILDFGNVNSALFWGVGKHPYETYICK